MTVRANAVAVQNHYPAVKLGGGAAIAQGNVADASSAADNNCGKRRFDITMPRKQPELSTQSTTEGRQGMSVPPDSQLLQSHGQTAHDSCV